MEPFIDIREQRKDMASATFHISKKMVYMVYAENGKTIDMTADINYTNNNSLFIPQHEADRLEAAFAPKSDSPAVELRSESTLSAILRLSGGGSLGVLNFASAKNPGGGFMNGAMAQEESLAMASALYVSQLRCPEYYNINRECGSMMYTDCAIWSPSVVFFRDDSDEFVENPVKASVLTLPAVNYGQVLLKKEDPDKAKETMRRRMKIALAIFAEKQCKTLILGAYGCGVFKNSPINVAEWWDELLREFGGYFTKILFAVLDNSRNRDIIKAFERKWGNAI